jgi:copper/silver efflux system protein
LVWSGSFEQIEAANASLAVAVPLALLAILILLYLATRSWLDTAVVWIGLSFSVSGAVWLVFLLGYEWSLAVSVGVIALLGLDAETTLVMLHYQESSLTQAREAGRLRHRGDLWEAIRAGAVMRIRPKIMTVVTSFVGLLPLMWADGAGADTMRRLAAPLLGGLISSTLMELGFFPALYAILRGWGMASQPATEAQPITDGP